METFISPLAGIEMLATSLVGPFHGLTVCGQVGLVKIAVTETLAGLTIAPVQHTNGGNMVTS